MARINGVNSDYKMVSGKIAGPLTPPSLDLKLWICPDNKKNGLELDAPECVGLKGSCITHVAGHAMVHLSQTDGISLVTDGPSNADHTRLQLFQQSGPNAGKIVLHPTGAAPTVAVDGLIQLTANGHTVTITPSGTGITIQHAGGASVKFEAGGTLKLTAGAQTVTVSEAGGGLRLSHANGSSVTLKTNGGMDLITSNNTGTVNIQGNLVVSGTLSRQGQQL